VVMTDNCGLAESISGRAGIVVPGEEGRLREAITETLNNDRLRAKFSQGGKELMRNEFGWEKVLSKYEKVYARSISSVRSSGVVQ
jgi:glycosyltransferase involved in cell wall biosynthesis